MLSQNMLCTYDGKKILFSRRKTILRLLSILTNALNRSNNRKSLHTSLRNLSKHFPDKIFLLQRSRILTIKKSGSVSRYIKETKIQGYIKGEKGLKNASFWANLFVGGNILNIKREGGGRNDQNLQYISEILFIMRIC